MIKVMILAAGRGERMKSLTDNLPKPLLQVAGKSMIERHVEALARADFTEIVINHAWQGEKIVSALGDGSRYGVSITYSPEGETGLETGGGILHALPLLTDADGDSPFVVINGDIVTDFDFSLLPTRLENLAHLVLVPNPPHHPEGDFSLETGAVSESGAHHYTFSGIGVYHPRLFTDRTSRVFPLAPILRKAIDHGWVSGELYEGLWIDVGTRERLEEADRALTG